MKFRELSIEEFNSFSDNYKYKSIYQTSEYGLLMEKIGFKFSFVGLVENNEIIAATLVLIKTESGFNYAYAPRGFLLDYDNPELLKIFTKCIKVYLRKKKVMAIKLNPMITKNIYNFNTNKINKLENYDQVFASLIKNNYTHLGYNNFFEALNPRCEAIINLNKSNTELFNNLKKEFKTKIRSSIKNGVRVYKGDDSNLEDLYPLLKSKYKKSIKYFNEFYDIFSKRGMVDIYYTKLDTKIYLEHVQRQLAKYEREIYNLNNLIIRSGKSRNKIINKKLNIDNYLNQYKNELIKATLDLRNNPNGIITSCIITLKQKDEITIFFDGYDNKYKKLNSKHLLIWQLIEIYKSQGFNKFNLGGMSNMAVDTKKYVGLNEFKSNFGSEMYEYAGDFELIANKRSYNLYRNYVPLKKLIIDKINK